MFTVVKVYDELLYTDYDIYYLADIIDNADKNKLLKLKAHRIKGNRILKDKFDIFINVKSIIAVTTMIKGDKDD